MSAPRAGAIARELLLSAPPFAETDPKSARHWLGVSELLAGILMRTAPAGRAGEVVHAYRVRAAAGDESAAIVLRMVDHWAVAELTGADELATTSVPDDAVVACAAAARELVATLAGLHEVGTLDEIAEACATTSGPGVAWAPSLERLLRLVSAERSGPTDSAAESPGGEQAAAGAGPFAREPSTEGHPRGSGRATGRPARLVAWVVVSVLATVGAVIAYALATAEQTVVVDIPEHEETFREETYETTEYRVTGAESSVCRAGQNWHECLELGWAEYRDNCEKYADVLVPESGQFCAFYRMGLDGMESENAPAGSTLADVPRGFLRDLSVERATATRRVSNGDYSPAVTHVATCYLGFIGECP